MGRVDKGIKCNVSGCTETAIRSISAERVAEAKLDIRNADRGYLCRKHYKELKKRTKGSLRLERWRRNV